MGAARECTSAALDAPNGRRPKAARTDRRRRALLAAGGLAASALAVGYPALAFSRTRREIRISKGYGILYLPLVVMERRKLFERHAARRGRDDCTVKWVLLDGGGSINDAMMAGTLDFAGTGVPGFIDLWARARGIPNVEVVGVAGLSATALSLNANRPGLRTLADFGPHDKVALPGIKRSLSAVVLQMAAAKLLGQARFAELDPLTVNYPHPEGMAALIDRRNGVTAHFTSPPFSSLELQHPGIHRVMNSVDVLGHITLDVVFAPQRLVRDDPVLVDIFLAALDEANQFIAENREAAASMYAADTTVPVSPADIVRMLGDPDTRFSIVPNQIMDYVHFLYDTGTIRTRPADWTALFVPQLTTRAQG